MISLANWGWRCKIFQRRTDQGRRLWRLGQQLGWIPNLLWQRLAWFGQSVRALRVARRRIVVLKLNVFLGRHGLWHDELRGAVSGNSCKMRWTHGSWRQRRTLSLPYAGLVTRSEPEAVEVFAFFSKNERRVPYWQSNPPSTHLRHDGLPSSPDKLC